MGWIHWAPVLALSAVAAFDDRPSPQSVAPLEPDRVADLRAAFEAAALPRRAASGPFTLRTSLPQADLPYWLARLRAVEDEFLALLRDTEPVAQDPNPRWTVVVFGDRATYATYMQAFVGAGAHAGGLYVESEGTLYTFRRAGIDGSSLEARLRHEVTHALAARFLFPGVWGEPGYHAQPFGWLDEGLAEVMANRDAPGARALSLSAVRRRTLCRRPPPRLADLLSRRIGYEKHGTFDYIAAWSFVSFLHRAAPDEWDRLVASVRGATYRRRAFAAITGTSVETLQARWHEAVRTECQLSPRPRPPTVRAPVSGPPTDTLAKGDHEPLSSRRDLRDASRPIRSALGTSAGKIVRGRPRSTLLAHLRGL